MGGFDKRVRSALLSVVIRSKGLPVAKVPKMRAGGSVWKPGDPTISVGEIAKRLAPIAPDIKNTFSKVRHWSREGMMFPVAGMHEGTGRARLYSDSAIYEAAILLLATNAGLNVASTRYLVDGLTMAKLALPGWRKAPEQPLYLRISREAAPRTRTEIEILHEAPGAPTADLTIVIDLAMLFSRIEGPAP
jgi:DNA-binding transcriptional MerR regulator